ncbi:MAG: hypothetical protein WC729_26000 [Sphingomonas sp.]|jgi:hypothetical protein|uniref:hypothetical protein n=1 Tax=Sphingomonas sp. TaxID=28214 RepID=UPI0035680417
MVGATDFAQRNDGVIASIDQRLPNFASARQGWALHPRSKPRSDGGRAILLEARCAGGAIDMLLTASEAAELMLELGYALEQAARADTSMASPEARRNKSMESPA